ncbi:MAG: dihydrofolate reductase family protein [Chloroflexota bacterium]
MPRPKLLLYGVASVDGRLTLAPDVLLLFGDERWSALAKPSGIYEQLLADYKPQAWIEGSNSFVAADHIPDPLPPVDANPAEIYRDFLPPDVVERSAQKGWFTVVDSRGRVRWYYTGEPGKEAPGSGGEHLLVFVTRRTPVEYLAYLRRENAPYFVAGDERVDLSLALEKLATKLGVERVISTSPGILGGALLRAGLVDEFHLEIFPAVIGGTRTPNLFAAPDLGPGEWPARLKLLSAQVRDGGHVWLRYEIVRE